MSVKDIGRGLTPAASRLWLRAIGATAVLLFAVSIAPLYTLAATCAMTCCKQQVIPFAQSPACAQECGINPNPASQQLPDAVAASSEKPLASIAPLQTGETVDTIAAPPHPHDFTSSLDLHHSGPGDPPLYVYNSAFLI